MFYRPEIDGLRALAVVPVILFHAGFKLFGGGYVGVDVFFVISGYLITSIIVHELRSGKFSFATFYERRARRILPALFFVLACCIPFAWMWMTPAELRTFANTLVAVLLFASNIRLWQQTGYFDASAEMNPLLHTWSLAVEEQFYIVFPVLLLIVWRFGMRVTWATIVVVALASFALCEWASVAHPSFNFFWPFTRAWELMAGSLCALAVVNRDAARDNALSALGLALIVISIFAFSPDTRFPSVYALAPVLGSCLIILFAVEGTWAARVLSVRPMVFIGLISYSAYLWHQPLFAFARIRSLSEPDHWVMFALALACFPLAFLSWRFVETPFRVTKAKAPVVSRKLLIGLGASSAGALAAFGVVGHVAGGFPGRLPPAALAAANAVGEGNPRRECISNIGAIIEPRNACRYGPADNVSVALLGDSHANSFAHTLGESLARRGAGLVEFSIVSCPAALDVFLQTARGVVRCDQFNRAAVDYIVANPSIRTVVIAGRWSRNIENGLFNNGEGGIERTGAADNHILNVVTGSRIDAGADAAASILPGRIRDLIALLTGAGKNVVIVYQIPEAGWSVPHLLFKATMFGADVKRPASTDYAAYLKRNQRAHAALDAIGESDRVLRIRPDAVFCNTLLPGRCLLEDGKSIFYIDDDHVNTAGGRLLSDEIADQMAGKGWLK